MLLGKEMQTVGDQAGIAGLSQMMELPQGLFGSQAATPEVPTTSLGDRNPIPDLSVLEARKKLGK
jgi:hypothetical protein